MTARFLTVDLGNSRAKLRLWGPDVGAASTPLAALDVPSDEEPGAHLAEIEGLERATHAVLSSVVTERATIAWVEGLAALGLEVLVAPDSGLDNRTLTPDTVGQDRLFAARGAVEQVGTSCLVLDAGSALTVDAVRVPPSGGRPEFLGGAIAPGPSMLARALSEGGARLMDVEPDPDAPALGEDTRAALVAGVSVGFFGAARELVERIAREARFERPPLVVTGGARAHLLVRPLTQNAEGEVVEVPELVHLGLALAAGDLLEPGRGR